MNSKKTVSTFFSIAFTGAFLLSGAAASAQGSALTFHGQLVNAGCELTVVAAPGQWLNPKRLNVNDHLTMGLVDHIDACEGRAVPLSVGYVERTSTAMGAHNGIVTLTYQ